MLKKRIQKTKDTFGRPIISRDIDIESDELVIVWRVRWFRNSSFEEEKKKEM